MNRVLSVTELNEYLRMSMESDELLTNVFIRGEISNYKLYKHAYFTLKDETGQLRAVMFQFQASKLLFAPADGMRVIAHGHVSVYSPSGQYQLYVDELVPDGAGALALRFEQLKQKLAAEGLFDRERKRPLPEMPMRIGVITSPSGAAVHDIHRILERRFPCAEMILFPSAVQGVEAPAQLRAGLAFFSGTRMVDVIILGRGGGSAEDLWAFNDEALARAVAACPIPVVSAVGHESDFTICDFVADVRAATPSAAAEIVVPDKVELKTALAATEAHMASSLSSEIRRARQTLEQIGKARVFRQPDSILDSYRQRLDERIASLNEVGDERLDASRKALLRLSDRLEALSPLSVLKRGYSLTEKDGKTITSKEEVAPGDSITVRVSDGTIHARVTE